MTAPHSATPIEAGDVEAARAAVRAGGMRLSASRHLLLDALFEADEPLSAEELSDRIGAGSNVASVYRNLESFEKLGLVRHVHLGHGPGLYVRAGIGPREYLICDSCGAHLSVHPAELDSVRAVVRRQFGYEASFTHFPISGLCRKCARKRLRGRSGG